jgi:hypothetical protein
MLMIYFLFSAFAFAVEQLALTKFSDQFGYQDNRQTLARDKTYSATKNCCDKGPWSALEAFPHKQSFGQVAIWCDQCGVSELSIDLIRYCETEFRSLYQHLTGKVFGGNFRQIVERKKLATEVLLSPYQGYRLRLSAGTLKCDGKGGKRIRVDLFPEPAKDITPVPGTYVFIEPYSITGCAKYEGGRGIENHCLKEETKKFAVGDELKATEFFYDDSEMDFGAKTIYLGTFRRIPLKVLRLKK